MSDYEPPSGKVLKQRQNETEALRLLIAQRRLYSKAKRWLGARWIGMLVIGLAAPVISVIWPALAVAAGAIAGAWLFLGRTVLLVRQSAISAHATALREQFDRYVFGMPNSVAESTMLSLEDIADITGPDEGLIAIATKEELIDWYTGIADEEPGLSAVPIAQRSNASYTDRLLRTTGIWWSTLTAAWMIFLLILSAAVNLPLSAFLLGILLPLLPAFLDVVQYLMSVRKSALERADLARSIEKRLTSNENPVGPDDVIIWQERLYESRKSAPDVPDFIYKLRRKKNEAAMAITARRLSNRVKKKDNDTDD